MRGQNQVLYTARKINWLNSRSIDCFYYQRQILKYPKIHLAIFTFNRLFILEKQLMQIQYAIEERHTRFLYRFTHFEELHPVLLQL